MTPRSRNIAPPSDLDREEQNRAFAQALAQAWRRRETMTFLLTSGETEDGRLLAQALSRQLCQLWDELAAAPTRQEDFSALGERLKQAEALIAQPGRECLRTAAREYEVLLCQTNEIFSKLVRGPWRTVQAVARQRKWRIAGLCLVLVLGAWGCLTTYQTWLARQRALFMRPLDLLAPGIPDTVRLGGLLPLETGEQGLFAWAEGPRLLIAFTLDRAATVRLTFRFANPVADQIIVVRANGREYKAYRELAVTPIGSAAVEDSLDLEAAAGLNTLEFVFEKYNGVANLFAPGDPRPLAASFLELSLRRLP